MSNRRTFIRNAALGGSLLLAGSFPFSALAQRKKTRLVILHTNDTHSHLEPFPANDKHFPGMGGIAARKAVIDDIRAKEEHVLLLDAGDIFQGTPYFNLYKGEAEIKAMSLLGYDCATMGNHDFDAGLDGFNTQLQHANFPFVTSNYDFENTELKGKTKKYHIINKGDLKIGIIGIGVQLYGLVPKESYGKTRYMDPVKTANETAKFLKNNKKCNFIICLSHLGYEYKTDKISDLKLAALSENIDLIIGGHSHTLLTEPTIIKNRQNKNIIINQVGWGGVKLGHLIFEFDTKKTTNKLNSHTVISMKQTIC